MSSPRTDDMEGELTRVKPAELRVAGDLDDRLCGRFGLSRVRIAPACSNPAMLDEVLGQMAADYLWNRLVDPDVAALGIGWSPAVQVLARRMPSLYRPDLDVISIMGALTQGSALCTFDIIDTLAHALNARCAHLAAPIYAGCARSRDTFLAEPLLRDVLERGAYADIVVASVHGVHEQSFLSRYGLPAETSAAELAAAGGMGELLGQFIDARGVPIDHPVNARVIALPLETLRKVPEVMLVAGGEYSAGAISAALHSGAVNTLVCDARTAIAVLELGSG